MSDFSVKQYLIDNKLVNEKGELICTDKPINPSCTWGLGPHNPWDTMIYLCTLVHFFNDKCMLDNLEILIRDKGNLDYQIDINEIDRRYDYAHPFFDWGIIIDTIEHLLPHMAGSNISYLAGNLFYDT